MLRWAKLNQSLRRRVRSVDRRLRESRMFARAMASKHHPILAQIVPIRRCNLACTYCNEFDELSAPVPLAEMLRRIDLLAELGTTIVTISGGEPLLHPDLDQIIRAHTKPRHHRRHDHERLPADARANPARLNKAGLDYLQISIDNAHAGRSVEEEPESAGPQTKIAGRLRRVPGHDEFGSGQPGENPEDARTIARRAQALGLTSTVGILHDATDNCNPLAPDHIAIFAPAQADRKMFSFAHTTGFSATFRRACPNVWRLPGRSRFLYICEDGLVHCCSQQRGHPAIPLKRYTRADLEREAATPKACAPYCTISCVHQTAMLDAFRENPRQVLREMIAARRERDPRYRPPALLDALTWMFLDGPVNRVLGKVAVRVLRARP